MDLIYEDLEILLSYYMYEGDTEDELRIEELIHSEDNLTKYSQYTYEDLQVLTSHYMYENEIENELRIEKLRVTESMLLERQKEMDSWLFSDEEDLSEWSNGY